MSIYHLTTISADGQKSIFSYTKKRDAVDAFVTAFPAALCSGAEIYLHDGLKMIAFVLGARQPAVLAPEQLENRLDEIAAEALTGCCSRDRAPSPSHASPASAGSGSTWCWQSRHHTISRTRAAAALPSVIGGPGFELHRRLAATP